MECPKCKAKVGIMSHTLMVDTGIVHCSKCYICGYWVQTGPVGRGDQSFLHRQQAPFPISGPASAQVRDGAGTA